MIPDRITPITGWRAWAVKEGALLSLNDGIRWPVGEEALARCKQQWSHDSPIAACTCGVYAHKRRPFVYPNPGFVLGTVALWGRVIEHENGYRSARAYPEKLWVADNLRCGVSPSTLVEALSPYGVPVEVIGQAEIDRAIAQDLAGASHSTAGSQLATLAREQALAGDIAGAIARVLAHVRAFDLSLLKAPPGSPIMRLPGGAFLHSTESCRYCSVVEGALGEQVVTIASIHGAAPLYYGYRQTRLDTRTGDIIERFKVCDRPPGALHDPGCPGTTIERTLEPSPELALETWLQLASWAASAQGAPQAPVLSTVQTRSGRASFACPTCGLSLHAWARHRGSYRCYVRSGRIWRDGWMPLAELRASSALVKAWPVAHRRRWAAIRRMTSGQDIAGTGRRADRWYLRSPRRYVDIATLVGSIQARRRAHGGTLQNAVDWALAVPRRELKT